MKAKEAHQEISMTESWTYLADLRIQEPQRLQAQEEVMQVEEELIWISILLQIHSNPSNNIIIPLLKLVVLSLNYTACRTKEGLMPRSRSYKMK